jgi:hypothetical protein
VGKEIDIKNFLNHPANKTINLLEILDDPAIYELWDLDELEDNCKSHPELFFCINGEFLYLCEHCRIEFDYSDKIIMKKTPSLEDYPEYQYLFFHEYCFRDVLSIKMMI